MNDALDLLDFNHPRLRDSFSGHNVVPLTTEENGECCLSCSKRHPPRQRHPLNRRRRVSDKTIGLCEKFKVERTDGSGVEGGKHKGL